MAVPTNTVQAVGRIGNREDLSDIIYDISPTDTPFVSSIGRGKAEATYTEWQTDTLVAANHDNKTIQGDDLANESRPATTRVGTHTQIFKKVIGTSTTAQAVKQAGRANEHSYQVAKAGKEMKRDMEKRFTGNYASVAATASVAGETAGALAWITTNDSRGAGGADGGFSAGIVAAATNGTQRAFTETLLKAAVSAAWNAGGDPTMAIMSLTQKQTAAGFAGLADARRETGDKKLKIIAGADVYVSDVGEIRLVPDRFCSTRDALIVDPELWEIATLDPMQRRALAVTGLADRTALYTECALKSLNESGNALIADLT
ncbi:DUF5309 domain-containing protein [Sphingopyxis bauzanensis]|uniref:DUF5309 domain-containing protein n=1 Tax=Sphingopyxis bauzanensis TaxID=651663 RepID=UPI0013036093|nr:DUF5309 domain-containing protein [Sphingopyxis bauzanensis]GGJ39595.1 hypothetical protein GCM10011393_07250 [Sphingopyxis bauzanensis]